MTPRHGLLRRLLYVGLNSKAVKTYQPVLEKEARSLAQHLTTQPKVDVSSEIHRYVATCMIKATYDPNTLVEPGSRTLGLLTTSASPPVPSLLSAFQFLFEEAKKIGSLGLKPTSIAARMIRAQGPPVVSQLAPVAAVSAVSEGVAATASVLLTVIRAMARYPDVQKRAQDEIDSLGEDPPTFDDGDSMPYVQAVVKEVLRCDEGGALGLAHYSTAVDEYRGYVIPKGTTVIPNIWHVSQNPEQYTNPTTFRPERFLSQVNLSSCNSGSLTAPIDPASYSFGFGRRVCPGAELGMKMVFIATASLLSSANIELSPDGSGKTCIVPREKVSTI
ncbi:hypothetical protein FRB95_014591 [Tulasnella sp. JGI-2019a]|nr:hypothetical protein FRB93_000740 [Tulasnella sp. JGI-2019a]KAG9033603.1 hypothetical protein FRB95_014591 [Tulasnella sp. JGI-2019a]